MMRRGNEVALSMSNREILERCLADLKKINPFHGISRSLEIIDSRYKQFVMDGGKPSEMLMDCMAVLNCARAAVDVGHMCLTYSHLSALLFLTQATELDRADLWRVWPGRPPTHGVASRLTRNSSGEYVRQADIEVTGTVLGPLAAIPEPDPPLQLMIEV